MKAWRAHRASTSDGEQRCARNEADLGRLLSNRFGFVPQNAINSELCLRLTNGKPALAHWIGEVETKVGQMKSARSIMKGTKQ